METTVGEPELPAPPQRFPLWTVGAAFVGATALAIAVIWASRVPQPAGTSSLRQAGPTASPSCAPAPADPPVALAPTARQTTAALAPVPSPTSTGAEQGRVLALKQSAAAAGVGLGPSYDDNDVTPPAFDPCDDSSGTGSACSPEQFRAAAGVLPPSGGGVVECSADPETSVPNSEGG